MKVEGRCHCGTITYEAEADPDKVVICNCTDCQVLSGSAFRVVAPTEPDTFVLRSGEPKIYVKIAESGAKRVQAFCPRCGSPIYATSADDPAAPYNLRVGTIRQRDQLVPRRQIWLRSAQPWINAIASIGGIAKDRPA